MMLPGAKITACDVAGPPRAPEPTQPPWGPGWGRSQIPASGRAAAYLSRCCC